MARVQSSVAMHCQGCVERVGGPRTTQGLRRAPPLVSVFRCLSHTQKGNHGMVGKHRRTPDVGPPHRRPRGKPRGGAHRRPPAGSRVVRTRTRWRRSTVRRSGSLAPLAKLITRLPVHHVLEGICRIIRPDDD